MSATLSSIRYSAFIESDAAADGATLRRTLEEYGYVFFRALVPADEVLHVRREALEHCSEAGWLDPSQDIMDAVLAPDTKPTMEGREDYMKVYRKVLRTPSFHNFAAQSCLLQIAGKLLDLPEGEVLVQPRRIGRFSFPNMLGATTPPHQDHYYIRGAVDTYSCWTPLGECPMQLGGLAIAAGSHKSGYLDHTVHYPAAVGGCGVEIDDSKTDWHTTDFGLGDTLYFHSYTIHKALPNLTTDRLRVSTDNRYQRPKEAIEPDALLPHDEGF